MGFQSPGPKKFMLRPENLPPLDGLIVLGAKLNPEGQPGRVARARLLHALAVWQAQAGRPYLLLSGGPASVPGLPLLTEAGAMAAAARAWAEEQGEPALRERLETRLILEDKSRTTQAAAHHLLPLVLDLGLRQVGLVSDQLHLRRALFLFRRHFRRHDIILHPLAAPGLLRHYWHSRRYLWLTRMVLRESAAWLKALTLHTFRLPKR